MKKVLILCDTRNIGSVEESDFPVFTKNSGGLRLSYQLRKKQIEVKTLYNFLEFSLHEFDNIFNSFSNNKKEEFVLCISTSFISSEFGRGKFFKSNNKPTDELFLGDNFDKVLNVCRLAKFKYNATVVFGGWLVSYLLNPYTKIFNKEVDVFVVNDGSDIIAKLAGYNISSNELNGNFKTINNKLIFNANSIKDFTDQSSTPTLADFIDDDESLATELATGCIFSCSFCNYGSLGKKKNEFVRSYESLEKEIEHNYKNFGTRVYTFTDNMVNDYALKLEYLIKIKEKFNIDLRWSGFVRLDTIKTPQQAQLLKDSGLAGAALGIESFTKTTGPYIGKMTDGERLKDILRMCREIWKDDVIMASSFIAGLPTETHDSMNATYEFLTSDEGRNLIDRYAFELLRLYPNQGTKNEINAKRMEGDPFKDFIKNDDISWKSPWGTSESFNELKLKFNNFYKDERFVQHAAFSLPVLHSLSIKIEDRIKQIRKKDKPIDVKVFVDLNSSKIKKYKDKVLNSL